MDSTLERLAEIQHGLVTNRQIDDCCATRWEHRRLIDGGPLLKAAPDVYRVAALPQRMNTTWCSVCWLSATRAW